MLETLQNSLYALLVSLQPHVAAIIVTTLCRSRNQTLKLCNLLNIMQLESGKVRIEIKVPLFQWLHFSFHNCMTVFCDYVWKVLNKNPVRQPEKNRVQMREDTLTLLCPPESRGSNLVCGDKMTLIKFYLTSLKLIY